jgi:hypothetical protein
MSKLQIYKTYDVSELFDDVLLFDIEVRQIG